MSTTTTTTTASREQAAAPTRTAASVNVAARPRLPKRRGNVLCFVVDTTQSMQNWIAAVRTVLGEVVDVGTVTQAFDAVGVMEYGDYDSVWCAKAATANTFGSLAANGFAPPPSSDSAGGKALPPPPLPNQQSKNATKIDDIPIRFSGWGLIGAEADGARNAVVADAARVSADDVHSFASNLTARGGGRVPEAVKTALVQLAHIAQTTLAPTTRVHVLHLTDAPMHLDIRGLDSEGLKEKAYLCGTATGAPPPPPTATDATAMSPFAVMSVFKRVLDAFALSPADAARYEAFVAATASSSTSPAPAAGLSSDGGAAGLGSVDSAAEGSTAESRSQAQQRTLLRPSRLHYTAVCDKPLIAGPYGVLAHLTGGSVVAPLNVEVATLRDTLLSILNEWMGVSDAKQRKKKKNKKKTNMNKTAANSNDDENSSSALSGNVCHLLFKTKPAIMYPNPDGSDSNNNDNDEPIVTADITFDLTDAKVDALCKCRRHQIYARQFEEPSAGGGGQQHRGATISGEPTVAVQRGLKRALQRCLARLTAAEEATEGATNNNSTANNKAAIAAAKRDRALYLDSITAVLRRLCRSSPLALCSSPALGKVWRAFTRRRDDPRRDELMALLQNSSRALPTEAQRAQMASWLVGSFDSSDAITRELKAIVAKDGVRGIIIFTPDTAAEAAAAEAEASAAAAIYNDPGLPEADASYVPLDIPSPKPPKTLITDAKELSNAFGGFDKESQRQITALLARMRVDRTFIVESAAEKGMGMGSQQGSSSAALMGSRDPSASFFAAVAEDDDDADDPLDFGGIDSDDDDSDSDGGANSDDDNEDDDPFGNNGLPFPANSLPLNLPLPMLFRLILSTAVPGAQLTRRPAALVATLAVRSGSVLRVPAALYLQSICGAWLSYETMRAAEKGKEATTAPPPPAKTSRILIVGGKQPTTATPAPTVAKAVASSAVAAAAVAALPSPPETPIIPENFVAALMRTLLSTEEALAAMQKKGREKLKEQQEGDAAASNNNDDDAGDAKKKDMKKKKQQPPTPTRAGDITASAHAANLLRDRVLTRDEHHTLRRLLRLSTLLRADNWEVNAELTDVSSGDGPAADYTLQCCLCGRRRAWSLVDGAGVCGYCHFGRTDEGRAAYGAHTHADPNADRGAGGGGAGGGKKSNNNKKPAGAAAKASSAAATRAIPPPRQVAYAPAPAEATPAAAGTYQVRCGNCYGYYSRDRRRVVEGEHRCFYCREASAPEAATQLRREAGTETVPPTSTSTPAITSGDTFAHVKICTDCQCRVVGAPSRPLPNGGRCAACALRVFGRAVAAPEEEAPREGGATIITTVPAAVPTDSTVGATFGAPQRRATTTTERTMRLSRLFPYRLYWRDMAEGAGLRLTDEWANAIAANDAVFEAAAAAAASVSTSTAAPSAAELMQALRRSEGPLVPQQNSLSAAAHAFVIPCLRSHTASASAAAGEEDEKKNKKKRYANNNDDSESASSSSDVDLEVDNNKNNNNDSDEESAPPQLPPNRLQQDVARRRQYLMLRSAERLNARHGGGPSEDASSSEAAKKKAEKERERLAAIKTTSGAPLPPSIHPSASSATAAAAAAASAYLQDATPTERRSLQISLNPFTGVANAGAIWARAVLSVRRARFGGEVAMCALCCEEFPFGGSTAVSADAPGNVLRPACGRRGCDQRLCDDCGQEWYGVARGNNVIGRVMAPRKLYCPCCARAPSAKVLARYHPDAAHMQWPRLVAALDTDRYHLALCRGCVQPREYAGKTCVAAVAAAADRNAAAIGDLANVAPAYHHLHVDPNTHQRLADAPNAAGPLRLQRAQRERAYHRQQRRLEEFDLNVRDYLCAVCTPVELQRRASAKACPNCKAPTFRDGGCFHMTCTICRTHWCYDCCGKLDPYDPYDHTCGAQDAGMLDAEVQGGPLGPSDDDDDDYFYLGQP